MRNILFFLACILPVWGYAQITSFPYNEDFESGPAGWQATGTSSFAHGEPTATVINGAASGDSAWVTNLSGDYNNGEDGAVQSPVFDFTNVPSPVFRANIWWESESGFDGTALQASTNGGLTWRTIGQLGDPNNWYNNGGIAAQPGGSSEGWSGDGFGGSGGWVVAERTLTGLGGLSSVILRFAFASDGSVPSEGFGFDDVEIFNLNIPDANLLEVSPSVFACGSTTQPVSFTYSNSGGASFDSANLVFILNAGTPISALDTSSVAPNDTTTFTFPSTVTLNPGFNTVVAYLVVNGDTLNGNDTLRYFSQLVPAVSTLPYFENFEGGDGGWFTYGSSSSWAHGEPSAPVINSASSGDSAWATNLGGSYNNNEDSYVQSPCFDLSSLNNPQFRARIWWNTEGFFDGAALQSSIDGGLTWQIVGQFGDPNNWYNDVGIVGQPGGQGDGWSGDGSDGSGGWVTAEHALTGLANQSNVLLRFAFGSDGSVTEDGFAFDDVEVFDPPPAEASAVAVVAPLSGCGLGTDTIRVTYENKGGQAFSGATLSYSVDGNPFITATDTQTVNPGDTVLFSFPTPFNFSAAATYSVTFAVTVVGDPLNNNDTLTSSIINAPNVATYPYVEDFENGAGGWRAVGNTSFALGSPMNPVINSAASGSNAWLTNLGGSYFNGESGFVLGPCFDFSSLVNPQIRMNVWWNSEFSWDGAALQASIDSGQSWIRIGEFGDPNNWYNDNTINSSPGGQPQGWTGRLSSANGSGGWVSARNDLDTVAGEPDVLLRVVFSSDGSFTDDGFAFDDIEIFEKPPVEATALAGIRPGLGCAGGNDSVEIQYANIGTAAFDSAVVSFSINGGPVTSEFDTRTVNAGDTVSYVFNAAANFPTVGNYTVKIWVSAPGDPLSSDDTVTVTANRLPSISTYPYFEGFENGDGGWVPLGANNEWQRGRPTGNVINSAAGGDFAYVTDTSGAYGSNNVSILTSPCLDFSSLFLPVIEMDIWWDMDTGDDGVVLQASLDGGITWQNVGTFNDPDNWYNDTAITAQPAGQGTGWTGTNDFAGNNSSGGWVKARNTMSLGGASSVFLRFVFASNAFTVDDGFGIDNIEIFETPVVDVAPISIEGPLSGCGSDTLAVTYINRGFQSFDSAVISYSINGAPFVSAFDPQTVTGGDTVQYVAPSPLGLGLGTFDITIVVENSSDLRKRNDTIRTTITRVPSVSSFPYFEDFEAGPGGWSVEPIDSLWQLGNPGKNVIQGARSGSNAWVTDSTNDYPSNVDAAVISPCFDFSSLTLPQIKLWVWWNSEFSWDGAVLQSSVDGGLSWQNVGAFGDPNNWYNDNTINSQPGGQQEGWTGRVSSNNGSGGWVLAERQMPNLAGEPSVRLRIAFASDGTQEDDGFAFDDVEISNVAPNDLQAGELIAPQNRSCADSAAPVVLAFTNTGSQFQVNFPVTVLVNGTAVTTTVTDTLFPGETDTITVGLTNTIAAGTIAFTSYTNLPGDANTANDTLRDTLQITPLPAPPLVFPDSSCVIGDSVQLRADGNGSKIFWYDSPTGGMLLAEGDTFETPPLTQTTTYYATTQQNSSPILITEMDLGFPDFLEIQNVSNDSIDATGWFVAVSNINNNLNSVLTQVWNLGPIRAGEVQFQDDVNGSGQYWGANLPWVEGSGVWALLVDSSGDVRDAVFYDYTAADISNFNVTVNGVTITAADLPWAGDGIQTVGPGISAAQRQGSVDFDDASNWVATTTPNPGLQNPGLVPPISAGCPSPRVAVQAVVSTPLTPDLGPDRAECSGSLLDGTTPGATSYLWLPTNDPTPTISVSQSGQYVLRITNSQGCIGTDTINIVVQPSPTLTLADSVEECGQAVLDAGVPGLTYDWQPGGQTSQSITVTSNGTYTVVGTNTQGCSDTATVFVSLLAQPEVDLGVDQSDCESVTLDACTLDPNFQLAWNTGASTCSLTVNSSGTFTLTATDPSNGCSGSDDINVTILPPPSLILPVTISGCDDVTLDAGNSGGTFAWSTGQSSQTITVDSTGRYTVDITTASGCQGSDTVDVTIEPSPVAQFSVSFTSAVDAQFTNLSTPSGAGVTYLWDFGDGNTSTQQNPTHTYSTPGNYPVSLTVTTPNCGSQSSDQIISTDIDDPILGSNVTLFPNPSDGIFAVGVSGLRAARLSITVHDLRGRELYRFEADARITGAFEHPIDLSEVAEGVYVVTVSDGERMTRKRIVKR